MKTNIKICPVCGKEFESKPRQKYCSLECRQKSINDNKKEFYKDYYKKNGDKYKKSQKLPKEETEKICPICGKTFTTSDRRQKYCSPECRYEKEKAAVQKVNDKRKTFHSKVCPICGKEFETSNSKKIFCSDFCYELSLVKKSQELSTDPVYKKEHSERNMRYLKRVKQLGMSMTEFEEFKKSGADVKAFLLERGLEEAIRICPSCGKEFYALDKKRKFCEDCGKSKKK